MPGNEHENEIRQFLRAIGRSAGNAEITLIARSLTGLESCRLTPEVVLGFRLIVQADRAAGQSDAQARATARIQLAVMVADGDLQIADDMVIVTEQGRRWLERQAEDGHGKSN
jgi:hypothetical protein